MAMISQALSLLSFLWVSFTCKWCILNNRELWGLTACLCYVSFQCICEMHFIEMMNVKPAFLRWGKVPIQQELSTLSWIPLYIFFFPPSSFPFHPLILSLLSSLSQFNSQTTIILWELSLPSYITYQFII